MKLIKATSIAAAALTACSASAVPQGAFWIEIPTIDHPDDPTDLSGFRTLLLYVQLEEGDTVIAADFGVGASNDGLSTLQAIFEHPFGADHAQPQLFIDTFPDLFYDTYVALGNLDGSSAPPQFVVQSFDASDPSNIEGVWNPNAPAGFPMAGPGGGPLHIFSQNVMWIAQITIAAETEFGEGYGLNEFILGEMFLVGDGPNGEFGQHPNFASGVIGIPNYATLATGRLPGDDFQMLAPTCGAENIPPHQAVLEWEDHPEDIHTEIRVSTDYRFLSPFDYSVDNIETLSHTIPASALQPCTTYFWYARAGHSDLDSRVATNWEYCAFTTAPIGDINTDGAVDTADLGQLIDDFFSNNPASDLNGDGVVDTADLGQLIAGFGQTCE